MGLTRNDMHSSTGKVGEYPIFVPRSKYWRASASKGSSATVGDNYFSKTSSCLNKSKKSWNTENGARPLRRFSKLSQKNGASVKVGKAGRAVVAECGNSRLQHVPKIHSNLGVEQISHRCNGYSNWVSSGGRSILQRDNTSYVRPPNISQRMVSFRTNCDTSSNSVKGEGCNMACGQHQCEVRVAQQRFGQGHLAVQESYINERKALPSKDSSSSSVCQISSAFTRGYDKSQQGVARLAFVQTNSRKIIPSAGGSRDRFNGNCKFSSGASLLFSFSRQRNESDRCIYRELESVRSGICISTTCNDRVNIEQNLSMSREDQVHCNNTLEKESQVVPKGSFTGNGNSYKASCIIQDGSRPSRLHHHPGHPLWREDKVRRMEAYRQGRPKIGKLSVGAVETLQQGWADKTQEGYGLGYRYYTQYCKSNELDPFEPSPVNLINYLQSEFDKNKEYRTINVYRSSVSSTLGPCPDTDKPVGQDPLVCRFMKGVRRRRPPKSKLFPTWRVNDVLEYLKTWGNVEDLTLRKLLLKTAFLVALVCMKRPSDLLNMQIVKGYWYLSTDRFVCQPLGFGKTEMHHIAPPLVIEPFEEDQDLCPIVHLVALNKKLLSLRPANENHFWIASKKPYKAIQPKTMAQWLKEVICSSGAIGGQARDVRSVGASTAAQAKLDLSRILNAGDWKRVETLRRHYFRPQELSAISNILKVGNAAS